MSRLNTAEVCVRAKIVYFRNSYSRQKCKRPHHGRGTAKRRLRFILWRLLALALCTKKEAKSHSRIG